MKAEKKQQLQYFDGRARRKSGILLHPSSLPGPYGIGEIGSGTRDFLNFCQEAGQQLWQILPLGPAGYGNSPYSALSSFAGEPLLICLEDLVRAGFLDSDELPGSSLTAGSTDWIDFASLQQWKPALLRIAAKRFLASGERILADFEKGHDWLDDFAVFMALREYFDHLAGKEGVTDSRWNRYWPRDLVLKEPSALGKWRERLQEQILVHKALQYFFFTQWAQTRDLARENGVLIIGDIPIFAALDSCDVWARSDIFLLDEEASPTVVAGVPPDYFSSIGQRWGNPLYNWKTQKKDGYDWWLKRIGSLLDCVDILRIDHFRAFESYWEIPAAEETAIHGCWLKGPADDFFKALHARYPEAEILAEDLGLITDEVRALRDRLALPGMNVLQFAFQENGDGGFDSENSFLPHNHRECSVVYTGTHDNDTTRGWYESLPGRQKDLVRRYLGRDDRDMVWDLIRSALSSVARYAIIPFQDFLELPSEARMNTPGTVGTHNWSWRVRQDALNAHIARRVRDLCAIYRRLP